MINNIKPNFTELGRTYNCDPRTVKRYYERGLEIPLEEFRKKKPAPSKLDPFKKIIDAKLELNCTAMSIFKFLQKKGFSGGYTIVKECYPEKSIRK